MARVVLAMSGGVDSSAAAYLLREQGHDVIGLFMRSGEAAETVCSTDLLPVVSIKPHHQGCCSASDAADARRVADRLDIPFHALNFRDEFTRIKDYFADEYAAGRTPNPCAMCNIWLKFGKLWDFARQVGADFIATGHYARVDGGDDPTGPPTPPSLNARLLRGRDEGKDQSYVLFGIRREILGRVLFPVGDRTKPEIRELARLAGIQTADKPDSQEICFIPDNDYAGFLGRYREPVETAGEIVDTTGRVLGQHAGYERYTIGQRRGLGLAFGEPRFVVKIDPELKQVVIGTREELGRSALTANRLNWLVDPPAGDLRCTAQIRYQQQAASATARLLDQDRLEVEFDDPQYGVAPGQAVVLFDGDVVLGGGWIA
ncbi:tRNA-specific 2-thiouridylase MnmA [Caulifigura coniformis]|uniref:tRNA-specific 2-thiouridylase MnmA n=1 Tax=Caulifigura coniformis TaxID=2527983 RepID=A0A517SAI4_9PLAN|nr:tRNA 2-thiouridine(34) synthase MnmA [Caulifigura coniformis]QDT53132.1 tRNA-specific 2-thiouridylase MnmA [Caulifigura coniformis]